MKTKYLNYQNKWSAFMTYKGYDYFELGNTEQESIDKLTDRLNKIK